VNEVREILKQRGLTAEIIVVDDGSSDKTARNAAAAGARVLRHRSNRGYGAALEERDRRGGKRIYCDYRC